jgi:hypothetical protein
MNTINFEDPINYSPNISAIPLEWSKASFETLDFGDNDKLKNFIIEYFSTMSFMGKDSLLFCASMKSFDVVVSIYKEIASRVTADAYKIFTWSEFFLNNRGWNKSGLLDLSRYKYIFILGLTIQDKEQFQLFESLMSLALTNQQLLFISSILNKAELDSVITAPLNSWMWNKVQHIKVIL